MSKSGESSSGINLTLSTSEGTDRWTKRCGAKARRSTRRRFIGGAGAVAAGATLAPALGACSVGKPAGSRPRAKAASGQPVRGGTLTVRSASDVSNLDYAFSTDVYSGFVIGNCVETLPTLDAQAQPRALLAMRPCQRGRMRHPPTIGEKYGRDKPRPT